MQNFGISMVVGGVLASSFKSSFKNANKSIAGIQDNISMLSKTKLDIKNFQKLSLDANKNKIALGRLGGSLKRAGIDVNNLDRDSKLLRTSLVKLKKASHIDVRISGIKDQFSQQKASILGLGASLYGVTKIIGSANTVLKAQGEIRSLDISTAGIDAITNSAQKMSLQFGQISAPEFIKASYDIKSGIASLSEDGVNQFTKFAATTAVATKATTAEMTKLYALGYGVFREDFSSDLDFGKQFSGAIAGAVQAFRTDGADLAAGISNIGKAGQTMGVSLEEQLSIIGVSKGAFASASEAGSGYRAFLDGTGKAQEKLGLTFVDSGGKMLPMVDILSLIKDKYGDLDLAEMDELKAAFGSTEAIKTITALLPKVDQLTSSQINLKEAMAGGLTKSEQMAKAMDSGYGFEKMRNAVSYLSFTIGKALAPAVDVLATGLGKLANGVAWLDNKIPFLVPVFSGLAAGILAVVTITKIATLTKLAYGLASLSVSKSILLNSAANNHSALSFNRVGKASLFAKGKLLAVSTATKLATLAQLKLNLAMLANPIGLVVAGLVGAGLLIYKFWQPIKALFTGMFDGFMASMSPIKVSLLQVGMAFKPIFMALSPLGALLSGIGGVISSVAGYFVDFLAPVKMAEGELQTFTSTGEKIGAIIGGSIKLLLSPIFFVSQAISELVNLIGMAWSSLKNLFNFASNGISKVSGVVSSVSSFFGFGNDKDGDKKEDEKTTISKPVTNKLTTLALTGMLATAPAVNALPTPTPLPEQHTVNTKSYDMSSGAKTTQVKQENVIHVVVNNPANNLDVEQAIVNAMRNNQTTSTSLKDEDI